MLKLAVPSSAILSLGGPSVRNEGIRTLMAAVAGSLLLTLSAKVQVPLWPVPMTMQTLAVLGLGFALGPVAGTGAVVLYLVEGAMGLPVFAGTPERGIGLAYMTGPTGGYLLGLVLAAPLTGVLSKRGSHRHLTAAIAASLGAATLLLCGFAWLAVLVGPVQAFKGGVMPFFPGAILTAALATILFPACRNWARV